MDLSKGNKMKKLIFLLVFIGFSFVMNAQNSNFTNIVASGDITAGDDISVTDDATIGGDATVTGAVTAGTLALGTTVVGQDTFTTTAEADTVLISGALATDFYLLTGCGGSVDQQDVLQAEAKADTLIVHRLASGASGLVYNWLRVSN